MRKSSARGDASAIPNFLSPPTNDGVKYKGRKTCWYCGNRPVKTFFTETVPDGVSAFCSERCCALNGLEEFELSERRWCLHCLDWTDLEGQCPGCNRRALSVALTESGLPVSFLNDEIDQAAGLELAILDVVRSLPKDCSESTIQQALRTIRRLIREQGVSLV